MSNKLEDLDPKIRTQVYDAINKMNGDCRLRYWGVDCVELFETKRSLAVQMAYYSRGRMAIGDVQAMYRAAGLYAIGEKEAKEFNTWTLDSLHCKGLAADIVPVVNGKRTWNVEQKIWDRMGEIGKSCGLAWGGDWRHKDYPHFELKGGENPWK